MKSLSEMSLKESIAPFCPPQALETLVEDLEKSSATGFLLCDLMPLRVIWGSTSEDDFMGYTLDELRARPELVLGRLHPDDLERASQDLFIKTQQGSYTTIYRIKHKDDAYRFVVLASRFWQGDLLDGKKMLLMQYVDISDSILRSNLFQILTDRAKEIKKAQWLVGLSEQDINILQLIGQAKTDEEIAQEIFLSKPSVVYYRRRLLRHFDVSSKNDLVRIAFQSGLI